MEHERADAARDRTRTIVLFAAIAAIMIAGFIVIGVNGNSPTAASVAAAPTAPAAPARPYTSWVGGAASSGTNNQHHSGTGSGSGPVLGM